MTESRFWKYIRPKLSPYGKIERFENRVGLGTPDCYYRLRRVPGWLELKYADEWPVRPTTDLHFNHFSIEQVLWAEEWSEVGERCSMLAQVERDYFIIPAHHLRKVYEGCTRKQITQLAVLFEEGQFPTPKVVRWLTGD